MKYPQILLLCSLLPATAQQAVDNAAPTATAAPAQTDILRQTPVTQLELGRTFNLPLPAEYAVTCYQVGELRRCRVTTGAANPTLETPAVMEICQTKRRSLPSGTTETAVIGGQNVNGVHATGKKGWAEGAAFFNLGEEAETPTIQVIVADGPHRTMMLTLLAHLTDAAAPATPAADTPPAPTETAPAVPQAPAATETPTTDEPAETPAPAAKPVPLATPAKLSGKEPLVELEGWGTFTLPLSADYTVVCIRNGDAYIFRIVVAGPTAPTADTPAVLEMVSSMVAPPAPAAGTPVTIDTGGSKTEGVYTDSAVKGGAPTAVFTTAMGVEGAQLQVSLPDGPHRAAMLASLAKLSSKKAETSSPSSAAPPDMSTAVPQSFRCWGTLTLPVPPDVQVIPQEGTDSYLLHVYGADKREAMTLYSGYAPETESGGKPCANVIAGETVRGTQHATRREYLIERGTQGTVLHIVVYKGAEEARMLAMLAGMNIQAPPTLPDEVKAQARYVFGETDRLTRQLNDLFAGVKDEHTAAAAVPKLQELLNALKQQETAMESLSKRYGRAIPAYIGTLSPGSPKDDSKEKHIQRVHDAECYGCEALSQLLEDFMGL